MELLVASMLMLMIFGVVYTAFIQTRKLSLRNESDTEIVQSARIGLDEMARELRMIGYHRDRAHGQAALIEAAPFQIIFNADVYAEKSALLPGRTVNLYDATTYTAPSTTYAPDAETIRWTLDSDNNGIVDKADTNDDEEEKSTARNANDMVLVKEVMHSVDQIRLDRHITFEVLGPYDYQGQPTFITPMFQYWLHNANQTFSLLGDADNDGQLTGDECYFRSITSQQILQRVQRIQITLTTESDRKDPLDPSHYRRTTLSSSIWLRNIE